MPLPESLTKSLSSEMDRLLDYSGIRLGSRDKVCTKHELMLGTCDEDGGISFLNVEGQYLPILVTGCSPTDLYLRLLAQIRGTNKDIDAFIFSENRGYDNSGFSRASLSTADAMNTIWQITKFIENNQADTPTLLIFDDSDFTRNWTPENIAAIRYICKYGPNRHIIPIVTASHTNEYSQETLGLIWSVGEWDVINKNALDMQIHHKSIRPIQ